MQIVSGFSADINLNSISFFFFKEVISYSYPTWNCCIFCWATFVKK